MRVTGLAWAQGVCFLASGVWPLLSIRSFEAVTGPKADRWPVKTVGVLVGVIGASLLAAACERRVEPPTALLAVGSAAGLGGGDVVVCALRGRIARVYRLDAVLEALIVAAWLGAARAQRRQPDGRV